VQARLSAAFRGEPQGAFISFASVELLWTVMTPRRWELLRALVAASRCHSRPWRIW
jgi:predicted transcriptional regulator